MQKSQSMALSSNPSIPNKGGKFPQSKSQNFGNKGGKGRGKRTFQNSGRPPFKKEETNERKPFDDKKSQVISKYTRNKILQEYFPKEDYGEPENIIVHPEITDLGSFTPIAIKENDFPTNKFIIDFFDKSWSFIDRIGQFYSFNSTFSLSSDHVCGHSILNYEEFSTNYILDNYCKASTLQDIVNMQKYIFPHGFFAYPTHLSNFILSEGMYIVEVEGVFKGVLSRVFGFNRTFVIAETYTGFVIINDHLFIRLPKI